MPTQYLFVYGTLRGDTCSVWHERLIRPFFTFISRGTIAGTLYSLGDYPGLVESDETTSRVAGEIYSFNSENTSFAALDEYEGCAASTPHPHDYIRKVTTVSLDDGSTVEAWCYFFLGNVNERQCIPEWKS